MDACDCLDSTHCHRFVGRERCRASFQKPNAACPNPEQTRVNSWVCRLLFGNVLQATSSNDMVWQNLDHRRMEFNFISRCQVWPSLCSGLAPIKSLVACFSFTQPICFGLAANKSTRCGLHHRTLQGTRQSSMIKMQLVHLGTDQIMSVMPQTPYYPSGTVWPLGTV